MEIPFPMRLPLPAALPRRPLARGNMIVLGILILSIGSLCAAPNSWMRLGQDTAVTSLAIDPRNPSTLYAATGAGLFKSTDGGASWSGASSGLDAENMNAVIPSSLVVAPQNSAMLYLGTSFARGNGAFKTTNGGSWSSAGLGGYARVDILAVDPQNPFVVYARALNFPPDAAGCCALLFKTTNAGATWNRVTSGLPNYVTALAVDARNPNILYAGVTTGYLGDASGVYRSVDGGASWNAINDGLDNLSITSLAVDPTNGTVYAGTAAGVFAFN